MGRQGQVSTSKPQDRPDALFHAGETSASLNGGATIEAGKDNGIDEPAREYSDSQPKILLVEDNWDHAYLVTAALNREGTYRVELATSGAEALEKLAAAEYDLVLLDYSMSGMNGIELLERIKSLAYDLPVIMTTGLGSESVAVKAMKSGAYDYVVKGGNYLEALPLAIQKALERHKLENMKKAWDIWIVRRNREQGALNSVATTLAKSLRLEEVLQGAVGRTVEALEADYGHITLMDEAAESACENVPQAAAASVGAPVNRRTGRRKSSGAQILRHAMQGGESLVLDEAADVQVPASPVYPRRLLRSLAFFPLNSKGRVLGGMIVGSRKKLFFAEEDLGLLNALGDQIGSAIENARLYEEIRRQADQIKESENKYRALVEGANDAVLILQGGRLQYINEKGGEMFGYSAAELYQMTFLDLVVPDYQQAAAAYGLDETGGKELANHEIVAVRKGGEEITLSVNGSVIEYQNRPALQIIARDVTEQKNAREQLIRSAKLAALGQFIAGVAHELNNPLASASGFAQILLEQDDLSDATRQNILIKLFSEIKHTAEIVNNLLCFARQRKSERLQVDINEVLESTIALRGHKLKIVSIEVIKELAEDLPMVSADPLQMQLVFLNIIINAEQAMWEAHKGGKLIVRTSVMSGDEMDVPDKNHDGGSDPWVQIEFIDNGPGISKKILSKIFDPFFTTKDEKTGTGLGLSIAHGIVIEHGGEISAHSESGKGATFVVRLPESKLYRA